MYADTCTLQMSSSPLSLIARFAPLIIFFKCLAPNMYPSPLPTFSFKMLIFKYVSPFAHVTSRHGLSSQDLMKNIVQLTTVCLGSVKCEIQTSTLRVIMKETTTIEHKTSLEVSHAWARVHLHEYLSLAFQPFWLSLTIVILKLSSLLYSLLVMLHYNDFKSIFLSFSEDDHTRFIMSTWIPLHPIDKKPLLPLISFYLQKSLQSQTMKPANLPIICNWKSKYIL